MGTRVIHAEWIGKHVRVTKATNPNIQGMEGTVVDETQNTITVETTKGVKRVPKHGSVFEINGETVKGVLASPEDRIRIKVN